MHPSDHLVSRIDPLTPQEETVLQEIRSKKWGEVTIKIKDGQPVMLTGRIEDIKLTK